MKSGKENNSKIAIIIGTKAELIKCMPIMLELQKQKKDYWFIHTGQHNLKSACEEFGIKRPDFILSKAPEEYNTKFWSKINTNSITWFVKIIPKIRNLIKTLKPKYVIYHGDTMSTAVASIASSKLLNPRKKWKNAHLEAGLRSNSIFEPFPEEISRKIATYFSDIVFAVSKKTESFLKENHRNKKIFNFGNTIVDSSMIAHKKSKKLKSKKKKVEDYALINIHRHENLRSRKRLENIVKILNQIKIKAIWPLHDNTKKYLEKYNLMDKLKKQKNIQITPLTSYKNFIALTADCKYLITDGGSIQEESLVFKKPCILLRKRTERPEGLSTGINFLTNLNVNKTKSLIQSIEMNKIKPVKKFTNPYGKPGLSKKILGVLR
ncbi:MAG: UDP-N-acetylglucosamine 2-epimerase (non-hydrolyzing) [Candidatus Pacearchaeota archaeon]